MFHRLKRDIRFNKISKIGMAYFFTVIAIASIATIWSIYLESFFHNASYVGFAITGFTLIGVLAYLFFIPFIEKNKKITLVLISLLFLFISYILFSIISNIYVILILGALMSIFTSLRVSSFGILVRDSAENRDVSKSEGFMYSVMNSGWFLASFLAGFIAQKIGFKGVFLFAAMMILLSVSLFRFFNIEDERVSKRVDKNRFKVFFNFFKNKKRRIVYALGSAVTLWWSLIFVYIPVYMIENGLSDLSVGLFLGIIMIPLIFLEYQFGKMAGKHGFKKMFLIGFLALSFVAFLAFFISNIFVLLGLFIIAGIFVSMIEPTMEAYFFDIINESERDKYYEIYDTTIDAGYFFGTLPVAGILLFLPFKFAFIYFGFIMFLNALLALTVKDAYEFKRK